MIHLQIYVQEACASCARSRQLAAMIAGEYSQIEVEIIEIESLSVDQWPDALFATPTWLLNGRRVCLGTPDPLRLRQQIDALIVTPPNASSSKGLS